MAQGLPTPPLTQLEFDGEDFDKAERLAKALGYQQTAYTSTSALWGLFCLPENPYQSAASFAAGSTRMTKRPGAHLPPYRGGCIIKTRELGFLFVQNDEDIIGEVLR